MPPHSCSVPVSRYCRIDSSVSCVISFEWSTGKMKFEAWPVEPPGFGNGPLSTWMRSVQPSSVSQPARLLPTIPPPITTTFTRSPGPLASPLEVLDVGAHEVGSAVAVADDDRLDEVAMRLDRLLEILRAVERDHPDAQREDVVLAERLLDQVVVRGGVDRRDGCARRGP